MEKAVSIFYLKKVADRVRDTHSTPARLSNCETISSPAPTHGAYIVVTCAR